MEGVNKSLEIMSQKKTVILAEKIGNVYQNERLGYGPCILSQSAKTFVFGVNFRIFIKIAHF